MIKTAGLTHIHLAVRDVAAAKAFYQTVFGMEDLQRGDETMVFLRTPGASDTLTLRLAAADETVGSGGGLDHFGFRLADPTSLNDALAAIVAAGGSIIARGEHAPGVLYAYASDLDGYVLEF